ncbi:MAG: InlB B-repeat-containing protein, partial [Ruminococcus sp.]|nr:InlB B-repeat-containing protein [Ruminococcus sp.]
GTVLATRTVAYGANATPPANPTREGDSQYAYTFSAWQGSYNNITKDTVITAIYASTTNKFTVTFVDHDGAVIATKTVAYGANATPPADPKRDGYIFAGWSGKYTNVTADTTVTATYSIEGHTVTFVDWNGTVLKTQEVSPGSAATAPESPVREGYTFAGWDKSFSSITADTTVTATYVINRYTVTFKDYDGTVIATRNVNHGSAATAPDASARAGYVFAGWDKDFSNVTSYLTVTATYTEVVVNLLGDFNSWSEASGKMSASAANVYTSTLALKAGTYEFKINTDGKWYGNDGTIENTTTATSSVGWEMTETAGNCILEASGGTYTFTYNTATKMLVITYKPTTYTVTFKDYDGTVLKTQTVETGAAAQAPAEPVRAGYVFTGWDKDFSKVTTNLTVTAKYSSIGVYLSGDFNSWSETSGKMTATSATTYTATLNLKEGTYGFKVIADGKWYGNDGTIEDTTTATSSVGWEMSDSAGDCKLQASGGVYTFTYNTSTKMLVITYKANTYTVTFTDWNGTVLKTQTVSAGKGAEAPEEPIRAGYKFAGWDKDFSKVSSNLTVNAQYRVREVSITGVFNNWDPAVDKMAMTSDNVYEISLHLEADIYTFKIVDDAVWYGNSGMIENTTTITSPTGWEMHEDTDNCMLQANGGVYTFKYNVLTRMLQVLYVADGCVVTFKDYNGTTLKTQTVASGAAATAPADPVREGYTFAGWDTDFSKVTSNIIVTALYNINSYTVTFNDWDGTVLSTETVMYGTAATAPTVPEREGYVFKGWDVDYSYITSNANITAVYEAIGEVDTNVYLSGSFNDWSKNTVMTQSGNIVTVSLELAPGSYLFKILSSDVWYGNDGIIDDTTTSTSSVGWEMSDAAGNCTLEASGGTYTFKYNPTTKMLEVLADVAYYTVTFQDYDGTVIDTQTVKRGSAATSPAAPVRESDEQYTYTFAGWDKDISNIQADTTFTATYVQTLNKYTVTFVDSDGTVLKTEVVEHGMSATAPEDPTKEGSELVTFTFAGWDCDFSVVTADMTVTATYTAEGEEYTVTFVDWDGTVLSTQSVVYSTSAIAPEVPVREGDGEHSYVFTGWDKDFSYVTEDMTITAIYTLTVNVYTVTFVNYDGSVLKTQLVAHGAAAEAPDTPSRPTTAQFRFTFDGWDTDFSCITADTTVKATYTAS